MSSPAHRLESIDALRGLAFLGVLMVHTGQAAGEFAGKRLTVIGGYGVTLFFIASAFTLLTSHHQRSGREVSPTLCFFVRRVFRIVPLFWAGILFYYLIYGTWNRGWAEGSLGWFHFGLTALLLHGWHPDTMSSVVPGGWSIAVEFGFYALAPFLFVMITDRRRALFAYLAALGFAIALNAVVRESGWIEKLFPDVAPWRQGTFTYLWLPSHLPTFLLGFLVYYVLDRYRLLQRGLGHFAVIAVGAGLIACALWLPLNLADYVLPLLLGAFVLALLADPVRIFVNRWTCALGVVSFSAYITHFAALKVVEKLLGKRTLGPPELRFLVYFFVALGLTAAVSLVTYRLIELPGIALGRKLVAKIRTRTEQPIPVHAV